MDFHSLTRKELQFLCKLNKIAANTKNHVMADALRDLDIVEGIEKFFNVSQSKAVDLDESKENVEVTSPKVPATRNRTTTEQKLKTTEVENLKPTNTRTTRRKANKVAGGVEESKNDALETPALSSTRRKALATSSCRNVNSQLNDCELDAKEEQISPAADVTKRRRKVATTSTTVKKETAVQKTYGTRRSTRQTEKKSGEPRVRKESEKAIEIISLLDEDDASSDEVSTVEVPERPLNEGIPNAEVEDICNALEELDVYISEETEDSGEVDNLKPESEEISNPNEDANLEDEVNVVKPEKDDISSPIENGDLEEEKLESEVMMLEEQQDSILDDTTENPNESLNSVNENKSSPDEKSTNDIKLSENMDKDDSSSDEVSTVEIPESTLNAVIPNAEVEDNCNAMEELDVDIVEEKEDSGVVDNHQPESDEISKSNEDETSDVIAAIDSNSPVKIDLMVNEVDAKLEEKEEIGEFDNQKPESDDTKEALENMVDETFDVIPAIDSLSPITEEVEDHQPEICTEVAVALSGETSDVFESSSSIKENDMLETPLLSTNRRKTPATSSRRNVNSELKEGQKMELCSRRKVATPSTTMRKEETLPKEFSSRRSTRLTEKKSGDSFVKKVIEKTEKIDSLLDEVNAIFQEVFSVEVSENTIDSDAKMDPNEKPLIPDEHLESFLEDNADVESDETPKPCEFVDFEEEKLELTSEEHSESFLEDNADVESDENVDFEETSSIKENNQLTPKPSTLVDLISHPTPAHSATRRKTPATSSRRNVNSQLNDCEKEEKECQKMEWCTPATVVASHRRKVATPSTTVKKEGTLQKEFSSRRSTRLTENKSEKSTVTNESEKVVKIDLMLDEVKVNFEEVPENAMDEGNPDAKMEDVCNSCEKLEMIPCENVVDIEEEKLELIPEEQSDSILDDDADVETKEISNPCANFDLEEEKLDLIPEELSENNVNGSATMVNEKVDSDSCEENQVSQNAILITKIGVPTPVKKIGSFVSDDKENNSVIVFGNKEKDEKNVVMKENLQDKSMRQLRKKLALTLKTMNANNNQEARQALQTLCENQLVGGETKN